VLSIGRQKFHFPPLAGFFQASPGPATRTLHSNPAAFVHEHHVAATENLLAGPVQQRNSSSTSVVNNPAH